MKKKIACAASLLLGAIIGLSIKQHKTEQKICEIKAKSDKNQELFQLMTQWVKAKQKGKSLTVYFEQNGYKKIAIYGMSYVGQTLADELKGTDVQVIYGIDNRANDIYADFDVVTIDNLSEGIDMIVVTAICSFEEIKSKLGMRVNIPVISLEDIIYQL